MNYKIKTLSNGVRFIHIYLPNLKSATFTVWYKAGSRYEKDNIAGISHFLEHMAFKGGKRYPTAKDVSEAIDAIGAENNASTSQEYTNYYVRTSVKNLPKAVDVLADTLLYPALEPKEIERERGVIIEEINMYEDDPKTYVQELYGRIVFSNNALGRDIAGTRETVRLIKRKDFINFRAQHYNAENVVVNVSGGIGFEKALELTEKYFGLLKKLRKNKSTFQKFDYIQKKPQILLQNRKTEQTNLVIGFPGKKHGEPDRWAETLMGVILGSGMSSRLFREVRERRGLAYVVTAGSSHYLDTGEFSAYAGVPVNKTEEAVKVILQEFYKLTNYKTASISKNELTKAKEFYKGHMSLSLESTKWLNYFFGYEEVKGGKINTPEAVFEAIDKVSSEEIVAVARDIFKPERVNLAIVGPHKDSAIFESILHSFSP